MRAQWYPPHEWFAVETAANITSKEKTMTVTIVIRREVLNIKFSFQLVRFSFEVSFRGPVSHARRRTGPVVGTVRISAVCQYFSQTLVAGRKHFRSMVSSEIELAELEDL